MERLTGFLNPRRRRRRRRLPGDPGLDRARLRRGLRRRARRERAEGLLPARGPHRHDRRGHRRGARACSGSLVLVGLFGLFGYAGFRTRPARRDRYGKLLAAGLTSLILVQATINLFAVLGLAPLTGVPLPFVSYGGTQPARHARVGRAAAEHRPRPGAAPGEARARRRPRPARAAKLRVVDGGGETIRARRRWKKRAPVPTVVIAAGGTAGHVVPALAVADALRASGADGQLPRHARARRGASWSPRPATRSTSSTSAGSTAATR